MTATQQVQVKSTGVLAGRAAGRSFWIVAAISFLYLFASSAPSPLYGIYAAQWHFSPISITAVFGVYALAPLATLLVAGAYAPAPTRLVYCLLLATFAVLIVVLLALVPETVTERRPAKLRVRVGVERARTVAFLLCG
ncbi:MAG: hypothetical protein ACRDN0_15925 [Trebonia sp.]